MKKKVSIMLTCYNCEDYIDSAIESVVNQDMPFEWELLVGDDGSSDATQSRVRLWIDKYPQNIKMHIMPRISSDKKDGMRAAKNRANLLSHAEGDYLIFLDGDDCFLGKEKIKEQVKILDNPQNKKCSCVAHNILANDLSNGTKYPLTSIYFNEGVVDTRLYWRGLYFHTNTILFRSCCKDLMLNEKYKNYLNDNFITYIILQYGSIFYLNEIWAQYNLTGNGLWTGKKRVYGCFRNLILFDLERDINSKLSRESFVRHLYDFRYIKKNYSNEDKTIIKPLVDGLSEDLFCYTFLLYKLDSELDKKQVFKKNLFFIRVFVVFNLNRITHIPSVVAEKVFKRR